MFVNHVSYACIIYITKAASGRNWSIIFEDQVIVQWPYWSRHVTYVSYVTIDTNHVMVDYFDVMNGRNYVTKDDLMNDAATSM